MLSFVSGFESTHGSVVMNKSSVGVTALNGLRYGEILGEIVNELEIVKALAPKEPLVYILLAQVNCSHLKLFDIETCLF
jgi:hypothetical protein